MKLLPRLETIGARDAQGRRYMTRLIWGRARVHVFHRGDADPDPHTHPWPFWTFPLTPYLETVFDPETCAFRDQVVRAFRLHYRPASYAHRVICGLSRYSAGRIVTLVWRGRGASRWGFWVPDPLGELLRRRPTFAWVWWRTYFGLEEVGE